MTIRKALDLPFKCAKDHGRGDRFTNANATTVAGEIVPIGGQGDEAGEPEQHGQGVEGKNGKFVGKALEHGGCQSEIGQHQEGPDGDEDHEADFRRHVAVEGVIIEPVGRCCVTGRNVR